MIPQNPLQPKNKGSSLAERQNAPPHCEGIFWTHLTSELVRCSQRYEPDNVDRLRFGNKVPFRTVIGTKVVDFIASLGFHRPSPIRFDVLETLYSIEGLDRAYRLFEDQLSRDLFVKILSYRILGHRRVRLPLNDEKYRELRRTLGRYVEKAGTIRNIPILGSLDLYYIDGIRLHAHPLSILNTFLLEQYRCPRANIGVKSGDLTIDAGGCWGDTALYFARESAQVFCFECIPSNVAIITENIRLNPDLSSKIRVVQKAVWRRSSEKFMFSDFGPGSKVSPGELGIEVETQTIDDFVSSSSLARVDFIKMDIEGSEPEALIGAKQTILNHRPSMAISLYHDLTHFASIPNWLAELDLGYRFYLDHFTTHEEETVLFATCNSR